jgi:hypothetical protein
MGPDNVELPRPPAGLAYFCWLILPCQCRGGRHLAGKLNEQRPADRIVQDGKPELFGTPQNISLITCELILLRKLSLENTSTSYTPSSF